MLELTSFETRANIGHAVLRSTRKPPKMIRRNGPTERRTDGRMDRPSYRGASQHLKIVNCTWKSQKRHGKSRALRHATMTDKQNKDSPVSNSSFASFVDRTWNRIGDCDWDSAAKASVNNSLLPRRLSPRRMANLDRDFNAKVRQLQCLCFLSEWVP